MRTLFCSHCNGILVPNAADMDNCGPGTPRRAPPAPVDKATEALGPKNCGGDWAAGTRGAEPPSPPRATSLGVPA